jgi:hypothetical protein
MPTKSDTAAQPLLKAVEDEDDGKDDGEDDDDDEVTGVAMGVDGLYVTPLMPAATVNTEPAPYS